MARISLVGTAAALLALAAVPAAAADPQVNAEESALLQQAMNRGALIFAYDRAAWQATDDMLAKVANPERKISGWIVDGPAEAPTVVFHDSDPTEPKAVYIVAFERGRIASARELGASDDRTLSPERKGMILAKAAATKRLLKDKVARCSDEPFNSVVLPPERAGGPTLVYFLTPQADLKAVPFGGHYLFEVAADGKASAARRFTNSCILMETKAPGAGSRTQALIISHLLDPVPTEIHVFSSLAAALPVNVVTTKSDRIWEVAPPKITLRGKAN